MQEEVEVDVHDTASLVHEERIHHSPEMHHRKNLIVCYSNL